MKKFLVLYFAPEEVLESMGETSPEEQEKEIQIWKKWWDENSSHIFDFWNPVGTTEKLSAQWISRGDHKVIGYGVMQAENKEKMYEILKSNPHMGWNEEASIEVSEIFEIV